MNKIKAIIEQINLFLKEVKVEMQKVSWPNKNQIVNYTIVVLVATIIVSVIIGVEDNILGWLLNKFINL